MATTFIQWKGTDLCMDFYCPECNEHSHFDGMFAYHIQCPHCETYFKMPEDVTVESVGKEKPSCVLFAIGDLEF